MCAGASGTPTALPPHPACTPAQHSRCRAGREQAQYAHARDYEDDATAAAGTAGRRGNIGNPERTACARLLGARFDTPLRPGIHFFVFPRRPSFVNRLTDCPTQQTATVSGLPRCPAHLLSVHMREIGSEAAQQSAGVSHGHGTGRERRRV